MLFLTLAPPILLFVYSTLSLILFYESAEFRDLVSAFSDQYPWLAGVFPALRKVPLAFERRVTSFSVGYIYHLYLAALIAFAAALAIHVINAPSIHRGMLIGIGRDVRYRKGFDDAGNAFMKIGLAVGFFGLIVIAVTQGWLWSPTASSLYMWHSPTFAIIELPLFLGALPTMVLFGIHALFVFLSPQARNFPWGVDAVREEVALNARNQDRI